MISPPVNLLVPGHPTEPATEVAAERDPPMSANAEILMRAFASGWGKGKPPDLGDSVHPDAELIAPDSMPYGGGLFRGRERIAQWFAEDLWEMWADFSSTPTDLIDGGDKMPGRHSFQS
jgi:ketosteroid isomerase-like protein